MDKNAKAQEYKNKNRICRENRPQFPKRAVVTAGMPYGNKQLHFGHIGGVFVHADTFTRFLKDRIGSENVIFVSGTDCYGSPILESYRKATESGNFTGTIEEYITFNHEGQKDTLNKYEIAPSLFAASALGEAGKVHTQVSKEVFEKLYSKGQLNKLSTAQFYDPEFDVLLNGRQVIGQCPFEGCQSDKAYADECALGHQYMPSELINPKSALSGKTPELRNVSNWYFKLEDWCDKLQEFTSARRKEGNSRKYTLNTIEEFLKKPCIYVQKKQLEELNACLSSMPNHEFIEEAKKPSVTLIFEHLDDRDKAREVLTANSIRFRTGKTLVPFRLSGNIEWGVPVPACEDLKDMTFWVWPESLWAPISFTRAYLKSIGKDESEWEKFWKSKDAEVYQFIGEDNIYFYGIAEMAMFMALQDGEGEIDPAEGQLRLPRLVANNHILFMDKKASSSSDVKPPMAKELLDYYTAEQLRIHFLSLGLANKSASFTPKTIAGHDFYEGADTVLKEGNLLTNVFNRIVRSAFYTAQKYFDSTIPQGTVSEKVLKDTEEALLTYEKHMFKKEFHSITYVLDSYIRNSSKYWTATSKTADTNDDNELRKQLIIDTIHIIKATALMLHPIAPTGCQMVQEYLAVDNRLFSWDFALETIDSIIDNKETHKLKFLEPRVDFFEKHPSQLNFAE